MACLKYSEIIDTQKWPEEKKWQEWQENKKINFASSQECIFPGLVGGGCSRFKAFTTKKTLKRTLILVFIDSAGSRSLEIIWPFIFFTMWYALNV